MAQRTKDPSEKYNDEALNPYQAEADAIFNRPDMQALNDRGDAIIRDHEADNPSDEDAAQMEEDYPDEGDRQMRRNIEGGREKQREAERKEWEAAENKFGYRQPGEQQPSSPRGGLKNLFNKKNGRNGAIAGGTIGIALAIFGLLTPFKIPALMQIITDEVGQRVEQITVHRAKVIMARAILSKFGYRGGVVITGDGPVASLIATMRTNNFEKNILNKKGLFIEEAADGVRLRFNGKDMGVFRNPEAIIKALDADKLTSKMINDIVKEEIPTWRWMKRAKFAKWLRIKYGIPRFGLAKSEETDKQKKIEAMEKARATEAYDRSASNVMQALDCMSEGPNCPITDGKNGQQTTLANADETKEAVGKTLKQAGEEAAEELAKTGLKAGTKLSTRLAVAAIPIVGWIDLAATINHFSIKAREAAEDDLIVKIPAYFRMLSYAQLYGDWVGYGDQIKAGEMDHEFVGKLSSQLDGAEQAQSFNCIDQAPSTGSILASLTGSTAYAAQAPCNTTGVAPKVRIDENNPSKIKQAITQINEVLGFDAYGLGGTLQKFTPTYWVLEGWYYASNKITDAAVWVILAQFKVTQVIVDTIASYITGVDVPAERQKFLNEILGKFMSKMLSVLGLTIDPLDMGADLMNNLAGGGLVSFNTYCKELGCRKLNTEQAAAQAQSIAVERAEERARRGWAYNAFSPDSSSSITNQLAIVLPTSLTLQNLNFTEGGSQLASIVTSTPQRLFGSLFGTAKAATALSVNDLYGVNIYGATAADLDQPLAEQAITGDACPEVAEGEYNNCNIDKTVAQSMYCNFDSGADDCAFITAAEANQQATDPGGDTSEVTASGFAWVLGKSNWDTYRDRHLRGHYAGGGFLGGGNSSVDIAWGSIDNTKVYAVLGGEVIKAPLGRSSRRCAGNPNGNDNGGLMIRSRIAGGTVVIAYAHGKSVLYNEGQTVQAGEEIMRVGNVGNSCGSHLHMDAAFNGKSFCTQDLFLAMDKGGTINLNDLVNKATAECEGRS